MNVVRELQLQARFCEAMGSPFVAQFIRCALQDYVSGTRLKDLLDRHATLHRPGLRLSGAFHYLALAGEPSLGAYFPSTGGNGGATSAWLAASAFFEREPALVERLFEANVQTNETLRSMPLLGAFLHVAARYQFPLRTFEIGASAGLNSRFDRYGYRGSDWHWGDRNAPLVLHNRIVSGRPQHLNALVEVVERQACDMHPIDIGDAEAVRRLESFVWPDQLDRLERLRAAIEIARRVPVVIEREHFKPWLSRVVRPASGHATVVFQSIVEEHLDPEQRFGLHAAVDAVARTATAAAPMAYVRMEQNGATYETTVRTWPEDDVVTICRSDGHAQDIEWAEPESGG
ncbi:MAG TPA: DUF2332 domain-containing protein [Candidatus Tumulicola sp.]